MEKGIRRLLRTAVAGTVAGAMLAAPAAYAAQRPPIVGALTVCVKALSGGVSGSIRYLVEGGMPQTIPGSPKVVAVQVGTCSPAIPAIRDEVVVYQQGKQGAGVRQISVAPPERLIEDDTPRRYVDVRPGPQSDPTVVTFSVIPERS